MRVQLFTKFVKVTYTTYTLITRINSMKFIHVSCSDAGSEDFDAIYHNALCSVSFSFFLNMYTYTIYVLFVLTSRDNTYYARISFPRSGGAFGYFYSKSVRKFLIYIVRTKL